MIKPYKQREVNPRRSPGIWPEVFVRKSSLKIQYVKGGTKK